MVEHQVFAMARNIAFNIGIGFALDGFQYALRRAEIGDVLRKGERAATGDAGRGFHAVIESGHFIAELLESGVVLRRPPVGGVAVLVVLGSIVVKGVRNLVRDDVAAAAEVLLSLRRSRHTAELAGCPQEIRFHCWRVHSRR